MSLEYKISELLNKVQRLESDKQKLSQDNSKLSQELQTVKTNRDSINREKKFRPKTWL